MKRVRYLWRIFASYMFAKNSQLTFWHGAPEVNPGADYETLGPYYMTFKYKALYPGPFDETGVPQLNYHGMIGLQYNPIAVAQYALGHYNQYLLTKADKHLSAFKNQVHWLLANLEPNDQGKRVWKHGFDFEYKQTLKKGWYSGLAQGQGLSVLVRARQMMDDPRLDDAIDAVLETMRLSISEGGVLVVDENGDTWLEEYLVDPPTHILNGFIWGLWGLYDLWLLRRDMAVKALFDNLAMTVEKNLPLYDSGYWSLYELSQNRLKMLASPFYHDLHIVQLRILAAMTQCHRFDEMADHWTRYRRSRLKRYRSFVGKALFKLAYY